MSTEKELVDNDLQKGLRSIPQWIRSPAGFKWLGIAVLCLTAFFAYRYLSSGSTKLEAIRWYEVANLDNQEAAKKFIDDNQGTPQATIARINLARTNLGPNGLDKLGTTNADERTKGIANIQYARDLYRDALGDKKLDSVLAYEAWVGMGKAEEALSGTPVADKPDQTLGSLDKALEHYKKALETSKSVDGTKSLREKVEKMDDPEFRKTMAEFYRTENEESKRFAVKPNAPLFPPSLPDMPKPFAPVPGEGGFSGLPPIVAPGVAPVLPKAIDLPKDLVPPTDPAAPKVKEPVAPAKEVAPVKDAPAPAKDVVVPKAK